MKNAPEKKEEVIRQLRRIRDEETAKPYAEMDAQLVSECVELLTELEGHEKLTEQEMQEAIAKIPFAVEKKHSETRTGKRRRKKYILVAACAAMLAVLTWVGGVANQPESESYSQEFASAEFDPDSGEIVSNEYFAEIHPTYYDTVQEAAQALGLNNFYYPTKFPRGNWMTTVMYLNEYGHNELFYQNSDNLSYDVMIYLYQQMPEVYNDTCFGKKTINGLRCLMFGEETGHGPGYFCFFQYGEHYYYVAAPELYEVYELVENLELYQK